MTSIDLKAQESINYQQSYVAFLDVLGFKNLVFSNKKVDKEKIEKYFGIVNSAIKYLESIPSKKDIGSIVISDSIILSVPMSTSKEENIEKLRHLCVAIALIQFGLAVNDIWIRGAISSGNAYFDSAKNQVVGEAYINAYLLESSLAITPRVILDNKIIKNLKLKSANELIEIINSKKFDNWSSSILFDWKNKNFTLANFEKDIPLFIDYAPTFPGTNFNMNIYDNIVTNMYQNTSLYHKFRWVSQYFILKLDEHDKENLLIEELRNL